MILPACFGCLRSDGKLCTGAMLSRRRRSVLLHGAVAKLLAGDDVADKLRESCPTASRDQAVYQRLVGEQQRTAECVTHQLVRERALYLIGLPGVKIIQQT